MAFLGDRLAGLGAAANTARRGARLYWANRSSRGWGALCRHALRRARGEPLPTFLIVAPTYRCVCRCVHCGVARQEAGGRAELTTDEVKSVLDQAARLGALQVTFTGGEPLLRDDLPELVRHARSAGLLTRINTTGLLLDARRARALKRAGLALCAVSIDDADAETHDRLRGVAGAHAAAVEAIRRMREINVLCQINTYASRASVPDGLARVVALGRRLGVLAVHLVLPMAAGRWDGRLENVLSEGEKARVRRLQAAGFVHTELATARTPCGIYRKVVLFVSPAGDVTPCPFVPYVFGNVARASLADIWRRHCASLRVTCRGECPTNVPEAREALRRHVESVAREPAAP